MKYKITLLLTMLITFGAKAQLVANETEENVDIAQDVSEKQDVNYSAFGKEINDADALSAKRMATHFESMTIGDSIDTKMVAKVDEVCQAKGCWMKVDLENGEYDLQNTNLYVEDNKFTVNGKIVTKANYTDFDVSLKGIDGNLYDHDFY